MPRLIEAPLEVEFCEFIGQEEIEREFSMFSQSDNDPVGHWLKLARARGETSESDQVLLTLIVELHRKIDDLSSFVKKETTKYINLPLKAKIFSIGYENFYVKDGNFKEGVEYYGRILMPIFPKRQIPLYFLAVDKNMVEIKKLHERDKRDWDSYFTARERVMIRELRAKK